MPVWAWAWACLHLRLGVLRLVVEQSLTVIVCENEELAFISSKLIIIHGIDISIEIKIDIKWQLGKVVFIVQ